MSLTPEQLDKALNEAQDRIVPMMSRFLDAARIRLAATSTQTYMRDAGITSPPFPPRDSASGPLRILSGRLSRSLTGSRSFVGSSGNAHAENITTLQTTSGGVKMQFGTRVPYAHVHEEGFSGTVQVPQHTRKITEAFGRPITPKTVTVGAHTKNMRIPARPYMGPSLEDNESWLRERLEQDFAQLMQEALDG